MSNEYMKIAGIEDILSIVSLSSKFFNASPYRDMELDYEKLVTLATEWTDGTNPDRICLITYSDTTPTGILAGQISEILFNRRRVASEVIWWVEPEFRGTKAGMTLFKAFQTWGRLNRVDMIQMQSLIGMDSIDKLYKRNGFKNAEMSYLKVLN